MAKYMIVEKAEFGTEILDEDVEEADLEQHLRELEVGGTIHPENAADIQVFRLTDIKVEMAGLVIKGLPAVKPAPAKKGAKR